MLAYLVSILVDQVGQQAFDQLGNDYFRKKQPALLVNKYIDKVGKHFGSPDFTA